MKPLATVKLVSRGDIGPSVPTDSKSIEDLLEKEKQLLQIKEKNEKNQEAEKVEDSSETNVISLIKSRRQKDPKQKRRGLQASTISSRSKSGHEDHEQGSWSICMWSAGLIVCPQMPHKILLLIFTSLMKYLNEAVLML